MKAEEKSEPVKIAKPKKEKQPMVYRVKQKQSEQEEEPVAQQDPAHE